MKWSPVSMGLRTTLLDNIGVSANSSFSLYGLSKTGNYDRYLRFCPE